MQLEGGNALRSRRRGCLFPGRIYQNRQLFYIPRQARDPLRGKLSPHVSLTPWKEIKSERVSTEFDRSSRVFWGSQPADFNPKHQAAVANPSAGLLQSGEGISLTSFTMPSCHRWLIVCR